MLYANQNKKIVLNQDIKFAILACDGLWDVFNNELALNLCRDGIRIGAKVEDICWGLVHSAINERHSKDNVSVLMIKFN
eukprot:UN02317